MQVLNHTVRQLRGELKNIWLKKQLILYYYSERKSHYSGFMWKAVCRLKMRNIIQAVLHLLYVLCVQCVLCKCMSIVSLFEIPSGRSWYVCIARAQLSHVLLPVSHCRTCSLVRSHHPECVTDWSGWSTGNGTCNSGNGLSTSGGEEKFYQCPYCPKIYTTTQSLHRHKHSHTGTNMKACPLCGKTSYRVDNLKSHIRNCYKKRLRLENMPEFTGDNACPLAEST